jgi:hypothetical protein
MILHNLTPNIIQQITAFATIVIAVLAFLVSIWQFLALRTHNRLSVRPLLSYEIIYTKTDVGFGIYICNKGVGPAIITDFKIYVDDEEVKSTRKNLWIESSKILQINYPFIQMHLFGNGSSISVGEKLPLLTIDEKINKEQENIFKDALPRIDIEIKYESIYKQQFTTRFNNMA